MISTAEQRIIGLLQSVALLAQENQLSLEARYATWQNEIWSLAAYSS
jgi:hypothetical protein